MPVEFRGASVIHLDKEKDLAILYTASRYPDLIFKCNRRKTHQSFSQDEDYISIGYGGFRTDDGFWCEPAAIDQKIVQKHTVAKVNSYGVSNAMWSGMSGGPVISKLSGYLDGYIIQGSQTQNDSVDVKSFKFYPISNIPEDYVKKELTEASRESEYTIFLD